MFIVREQMSRRSSMCSEFDEFILYCEGCLENVCIADAHIYFFCKLFPPDKNASLPVPKQHQQLINSLRTPACERQNSSYRSTFSFRPGKWATVRLPWDSFDGHGSGPDSTPFVPTLRRLGVVSIGEAKDVTIAVRKIGFYNVI